MEEEHEISLRTLLLDVKNGLVKNAMILVDNGEPNHKIRYNTETVDEHKHPFIMRFNVHSNIQIYYKSLYIEVPPQNVIKILKKPKTKTTDSFYIIYITFNLEKHYQITLDV